MQQVLANCSASISELKKNPTALLKAYLVPAETYEWMIEQLEDQALAQLVEARRQQRGEAIEVSLDDL